MLAVLIEVELDAVDYQTDAFGALKPTTAGRTLDVSAGGEAGIDLANVGSPTTTLTLSGTTIKAVTDGVTVTTNNDKGNYSLSTAGIQAIWDALTSALTTAGSIGKWIIDNLNTTVSSRATQTSVDAVDDFVDTEVAAIKTVTDKLDTMVELDGVVYRYTTNALEQAPHGGGGGSTDWTSSERTAIRAILGIPSSGTTPTDPTSGILDTIRDLVVVVDTVVDGIAANVDTEVAAIKAKTDLIPADIGSVLVAANANRTVQVTGSNHVAADIHELQPAVIDNTHFVAGAIDSNALAASAATKIATAVGALTQLVDLTTMIINDGTANARFSTSALQNAPSGGGGGGTGTGARTVVVTVTLSASPVEGASVRLTKAAETYVGSTNASGQVTFNVDDGTWTVAITSPGATFAGASLVVDDDETVSYSLTAISITPSPATQITGYYTCYSHLGVVEAGVSITMQLVGLAQGSVGLALDNRLRTVTSDANGVAQFTNLFPGCRYKVYRGAAENKAWYVNLPDTVTGDPVELGSIYGDDE
jgi:hypothetical protein